MKSQVAQRHALPPVNALKRVVSISQQVRNIVLIM